jgi:hypothetical protein
MEYAQHENELPSCSPMLVHCHRDTSEGRTHGGLVHSAIGGEDGEQGLGARVVACAAAAAAADENA